MTKLSQSPATGTFEVAKRGWKTTLLTVLALLFAVEAWTPSQIRAQTSIVPVEKIAFIAMDSDPPVLAVMDADGSNVIKLTSIVADEPAWSPDGSRLVFTSGGNIFVVPAAGGTAVALTNNTLDNGSPAWSPDGTKIAFTAQGHIFVVAAAGGTPVSLTGGAFPAWSPDGTKIAFSRLDLYVMNADGSGVAPLTTGVTVAGRPAWSPDGARLAFTCWVESLSVSYDVCAVNADASGLAVLTTNPADDVDASWSPDGANIAFAASYGDWTWCDLQTSEVAVMNPDGSGVSPLGPRTADGLVGRPTWSPDGARIAFTHYYCFYYDFGNGAGYYTSLIPSVAVMNADGTGLVALYGYGHSPAWRPTGAPGLNDPPVASFTSACNGHPCSFDGSGSWDFDGTITSHAWDFGDGTMGSGAMVSHTYVAGGTYTVTLTVTDDGGATGTKSQAINVTDPPVASFTSACSGLTCTFAGSGSSDPDGTIATYAWNFGDGTAGSGAAVSHTYVAGGTYTVTLTVTDNGGATGTQSKNVTVSQAHVADLDRASTSQPGSWTAIVTTTVHDSSHSQVANATVSGFWSTGGTGSCTTNGIGQCTVSKSGIPKKTGSVTFTVVNVTHATLTYDSAANHDPDGDSNGTSITLRKP